MFGLAACAAPSATPIPPTPTLPPTSTRAPLPSTSTPTATPLPPTLTWTPSPQATATLRPSAATSTPAVFRRTLQLADPYLYGDDVLALQLRLLDLGYDQVGEADGIFGGNTLRAVKEFQSSQGWYVDGIVGAFTWQVLFDPATVYEKGHLNNDRGLTDTVTCAYDDLWMSLMRNLAVADPHNAYPQQTLKVFEEEDALWVNGPWAAGGLVWDQETIGDFYAPDTGDFLVGRDPDDYEIKYQWRLMDLLYWEPTVYAIAEVDHRYWILDHQGLVYVVEPADPPYVAAQYYFDDNIHHLLLVNDKVWATGDKNLYQLSPQDGSILRTTQGSYDSMDFVNGKLWVYSWSEKGLVEIDLDSGDPLSVHKFEINGWDGCFDGKNFWYIEFFEGMIQRVEVFP